MLTWHFENTGGRFSTQPRWLFVTLTPINTADFFAIDNVEADANWLRLRVALNHTSGHDFLGGFNAVVESTTAKMVDVVDSTKAKMVDAETR